MTTVFKTLLGLTALVTALSGQAATAKPTSSASPESGVRLVPVAVTGDRPSDGCQNEQVSGSGVPRIRFAYDAKPI